MKNYLSIFLMTSLLILVSCMDPTSSEDDLDDEMTGPDPAAEAMRLAEYLEIIMMEAQNTLDNNRNLNFSSGLTVSHKIVLNLKRDLSSLILMDNNGSFVFDQFSTGQISLAIYRAGGNYIEAKSGLSVFREAKMDSSDMDTSFSIEKVILEFKDDNGDVTREEFCINQSFSDLL